VVWVYIGVIPHFNENPSGLKKASVLVDINQSVSDADGTLNQEQQVS